MTQFTKLFEPIKIGNVELKNRIVLPPMACSYASEDGFITDRFIDYYAERAKGGCALIIIESSYPRPAGYHQRPNLGHDKYIPGLAKLADAIHKGGAKACIQLLPHKGRNDLLDPATASESIHPATGAKIRALTLDDINRLINEFGEATRRVKEAGFDCIQVHGGSGYLISEFLSHRINKRTDEYGGDAKKRAKFAINLVAEAKKKAGADYPVIYRMVADERTEGGFGMEDAVFFGKVLEEASVDSIDVVSGGTVDSFVWLIPYMYLPNACNVHISEAMKKEVTTIPIGVAGKILHPELAEQVLREGKADYIDMGRAFIADPHFPQKAMEGRLEDICECIACLRCAESILSGTDYHPEGELACSVNPAVGREREFEEKIKPVSKKKKVLVIGGGPAGMEAAIVTAQKGHDVTIWEKEDKLGGTLNLAVVPPGKDDMKSAITYPVHMLDKLKVKVALGKEATAEAVLEFSPDAVVVSCGTKPLIPKIKGLDKRKLITFRDVLSGKVEVGKKVGVIGGGFVGCELADFLAEKGKKVTVIEILPKLASELFPPIGDLVVKTMFKAGDVQAFTEVKEEEITDKGLEIVDKDGKKVSIEADDIVISAGSVADKTLFESLKGKVPELYEVGDCVSARRMQEAVYEGASAGLAI